jgi:hypothetical protein
MQCHGVKAMIIVTTVPEVQALATESATGHTHAHHKIELRQCIQ